MATLSPSARQHRKDLAALYLLADRDLSALFRDFDSPDSARDGLMDVLPRLLALYGAAAAALGADWYDDLRDEAGARGVFTAIPAELPDRGRTDALARWAVGPLFTDAPDFLVALSLASGGLQRSIANADRDTIRISAVEDRQARGWSRAGIGDCDYCRERLGGVVYTDASVDFGSHDRCNCIAVPEF